MQISNIFYRIFLHAFNWVEDDSDLIEFDNSSFNENEIDIYNSCKIYRIDDDVKIEYFYQDSISQEKNLNENKDILKLGEIKYKKNKFYFIPNIQEELEDLNGDKIFSWLIFKGEKYPMTKNKYKIKEGDIFRLARIYFIVRGIHVQKKIEKKETNVLISYHSNINQSLNINNNYSYENKLLDNSSDSSNTDVCEEENESDDDNNKDNEILKVLNKEKKKKKKSIYKKKKNCDKNLIDDLKLQKANNIKSNLNQNHLITNDSKKSEKQKICRICYMGEIDKYFNPLIKPCKCSGSMKYIHFKCLLHWMKTKIQIKKSEYIENNYFSLYSPEKVECELCKNFFPHFIKHNNKLFNLTELEQNYDYNLKENNNNTMDDNYIVLDSMSPDKDIIPYRYIVKFDKNNILKIGRGLDNNLILDDLSISRNHCQLELNDNGDIFLKDNNSKFGTLILVQAKSLEILKGQVLSIQTGRTYLNIYYKKNSTLFGCCKAEEIDFRFTYEQINNKDIKIDKNSDVLTESESEEDIDNKKDDEDKKENEYENNIKTINNKKLKIMKISKKDKKKLLNTDLNSNDIKKERSKSKKKLTNLNDKENEDVKDIINKKISDEKKNNQ